ncbi:hypothetical protein ABQJ54_04635 [Rhodanobacter sp. Si-c]|uniref:Uncharacterized protein n=1 Tax=Rhodanobacter lycopersici TaxID=3162487 RepID=A0ABV3QBF5_9GAMM
MRRLSVSGTPASLSKDAALRVALPLDDFLDSHFRPQTQATLYSHW